MNAIIKRKIGRGVKEANRRRRMSAAMKASWARRRTLHTPISIDDLDEPVQVNPKDPNYKLTHLWSDDDLVEVARTMIGRENVRKLLSNAIKEVLL